MNDIDEIYELMDQLVISVEEYNRIIEKHIKGETYNVYVDI